MKIYNTLTRRKEELVPMDANELKMYVCGPTVYNYIHIGNARPFVVFDTMRKYLEYRGQKVKYVQNFTDVDDKIINRAREEGISALEVGQKYIDEYFKDVKELNITPADVHPRVTETMPDIIEFVQGLIDKGMAYEVDGDVYYSTRKFRNYGQLSGNYIEDLEVGARIPEGEKKKDPLDFALWKARKSEDEIAWESPWGLGRQVGILNAQLCLKSTLAKPLTFTAAVRTYSSHTTKMKLLSQKDFPAKSFLTTGCTMASLQ